LLSTTTTKRGSFQLSMRAATGINALMPFICIAPSPTIAITGRSG
jgi:hypothetical protein